MLIALWVILLWSSNLVLQKIAVTHLPILVLSFLRVGFVFPLLFLFPRPSKHIGKYFLCGFFWSALYITLFGYGIQTSIGAGISAFFMQLQVFFSILCCFLILGEKPTGYQTLGLLLSFAGVYMLTTTSLPAEIPLLGAGLLVASCLSFGLGLALSKKFQVGGTMGDVTWISMTAAVPLFFACMLFEGPLQTYDVIINMPSIALFCVLFATVASTIWATYLWFRLLGRAPASAVTPFMLLLPVASNVISYFILGETLSNQQFVSGAIIIGGVMLAQGIHLHVPVFANWLKNN